MKEFGSMKTEFIRVSMFEDAKKIEQCAYSIPDCAKAKENIRIGQDFLDHINIIFYSIV